MRKFIHKNKICDRPYTSINTVALQNLKIKDRRIRNTS